MTPAWLKSYYGKEADNLRPVVVIDGEKKAVVRITKNGKFGFVLLAKTGLHNSTPITSLHEGLPSADDLKRMKAALEAAEN